MENPTYDELVAATVAARDVITQMHQATKDLSDALRKTRHFINEEVKGLTTGIPEEIQKRVDTEIGILKSELRAAMNVATKQIQDDFAKISDKQNEILAAVDVS